MTAAGLVLRARDTRRVLLLLRPEGLWGFPGGHLEPRENALQAAVRETREETGYQGPLVLDGPEVAALVFPLRGGPLSLCPPPLRGAAFAYAALAAWAPQEFHATLDGEHLAARWVTDEEAVRMALHPGVVQALRVFSAATDSEPSHSASPGASRTARTS